MIGDSAREHVLSAGMGRRRHGKACTFGTLYREVLYNSIVQNRQVVNGIRSSPVETYMKIRFYAPSGNYIVTTHGDFEY